MHRVKPRKILSCKNVYQTQSILKIMKCHYQTKKNTSLRSLRQFPGHKCSISFICQNVRWTKPGISKIMSLQMLICYFQKPFVGLFNFLKSVSIRSYSGSHFPALDWIRRDTPYFSVQIRMWKNADQNNSKHGHFLRSVLATHKLSYYKIFYLASWNY